MENMDNINTNGTYNNIAVQSFSGAVCEVPASQHAFSKEQIYVQLGVPYEAFQGGDETGFDEQAAASEDGSSAAARFFYVVFAILCGLASFAGVTFLLQR